MGGRAGTTACKGRACTWCRGSGGRLAVQAAPPPASPQVRRWTLPKRLAAAGQASASILDCDRVVLPVHQGLHWVCAVIDLQRQRFIYYDSLKVGGMV